MLNCDSVGNSRATIAVPVRSKNGMLRSDPVHPIAADGQLAEALVTAVIEAPILPTVYPTEVETLCRYADVLHDEGYPALEILARPLDQALTVMREIARRPQRNKIRWGIGTMRTAADASAALELQPDFLVSPAFSRRVLQVTAQSGMPYIPAVHTFQDVQNVLDAFDELGLTVRLLKLCPVFGLTRQYVTSLCGCFPGIVFCPTGEVELDNYLHWKKIPGIVAPMGSGFVPRLWLENGDWPAVRARLRQIRSLAETAALSLASQ